MSRPYSLIASPVLSREEAQALLKRALSFSTAEAARVTLTGGTRGNTRFAVNQVSTSGDNSDSMVTVRSVFGKRTGSVTTNRFDDASLRDAVQLSERLAKLAPEDPELMPELDPQQYQETLGWSDASANASPDNRASAVRAVTDPAAAQGLVATGYMETDTQVLAVANSKGLFAYGRGTAYSMTTTVRTPDGTGSGWAGGEGDDWAQLDARALGARAIDKAVRSRDPVAVEPGRYTVILEPTAVGNLVQLLAFALNARNADEGRSFFTKPGGGNKIGQQVIDSRVSIVSDPLDSETYAFTFSGEGLPLSRTPWIENGVVKHLAYDRFWAQKQGTEPRPLIGAIKMSGGDKSMDELIASTDRGILVTRFWYIRSVDPRTILYTGLTRDGTFLIENGKITHAVKNLRFNESPVFMLNNLDAMGKPVRVCASEDGSPGFSIVVPPIKVHDFTFTSLSDAI